MSTSFIILEVKGQANSRIPFKWLVQTNDERKITHDLNCWNAELAEELNLQVNEIYDLPVKKPFSEKYGFALDEKGCSKRQLDQFFLGLNKNLLEEEVTILNRSGDTIVRELKKGSLFLGYKPYKEYSPSSVFNCMRIVLLNKWANDFSDEDYLLLLKRFEETNQTIGSNYLGEATHNQISYHMKKNASYVNHEETIRKRYRNENGSITIKGRYDLLLRINGVLVVVDIKTRQNQYQYPSGKLQQIYKEIVAHNIAQTNIYQDLVSEKYQEKVLGAILEVFSNGESRLIPVKFDESEFEKVLRYFYELSEFEEERDLPVIHEGFEKDKTPCSFCLFNPICWKDEEEEI